jgi:diguanylate cyclase (GGDEF)-like protein
METISPNNFLILVVDDISDNLQMLGVILEEAGYITTFAPGGEQALNRLKTVKPDLILLDLMMPQMNGLELCQNLKNNENYRDIPIIFISATNESKFILEAFELGAVDYIIKPFDLDELLARIKVHLQFKNTQDQLKQAMINLGKLATIDTLTGIPNHRYLLIIAEQEINRASRYNYPLSVLMMDIDNFKKINDKYGHSIGDKFLQLIAQTTSRNLRKDDCFVRLGGEEFLIILPHTTTRFALEAAQRTRQLIGDLSLVINQEVIQVTVSIGLATYCQGNQDIDLLLKRVDEALQEAKKRGKNRVIVHSEDIKNLLAS